VPEKIGRLERGGIQSVPPNAKSTAPLKKGNQEEPYLETDSAIGRGGKDKGEKKEAF